jgi:hypothetical protein
LFTTAVLCLIVATTLVVPLGAAAGASSRSSGAGVLLVSQSPYVTPGGAFNIGLALTNTPALSELEFSVSVYAKLTGRLAFQQTLNAIPDGRVIDRVGLPGTLSTSGVTLGLTVDASEGTTPTAIDLHCTLGTGSCPGVYPVLIDVERASDSSVITHLTTYLNFDEVASASKLRVAVFLPLGAPVAVNHSATNTPAALSAPNGAMTRALDSALSVLAAPGVSVPLSLAPSAQTLDALAKSANPIARRALRTLSELGEPNSPMQFIGSSYVPTDLGALAGAGLTGEIQLQVKAARATLNSLGVHPSGHVWVSSGAVGTDLAEGLAYAGARAVVVPDTDIATNPVRLGISQPFDLVLGHKSVLAAAADSGLTAHFADDERDPALAANQLLADLSFIQSEAPDPESLRGVVAAAPAGWVPNATFLRVLVDGLNANPALQAVTLSNFFAQVPLGGNGAPMTRRPVNPGPGPRLADASAFSSARIQWNEFSAAVRGVTLVPLQLNHLLLSAESNELSSGLQSRAIATFHRLLLDQLDLFELSEGTITLTARTARIPITIVSAAPYDLVGRLVLVGDRFKFPDGPDLFGFQIHPNTNSVRIAVEALTTGDLPLTVTFEALSSRANQPPLIVIRHEVTVRSTATSLAGVILTLVAAVVLLSWWARTWWRGRRRSRRTAR